MSFKEVEGVFHKYLHLEDKDFVGIVLATVMSNEIQGDPLWLFIVAPPGSGKTEILRSFFGCNRTHFASSFRGKSFVSGKRDDKGKDPSLLKKVDGKVLIIKDFTPTLMAKYDIKNQIFSDIRDAFDGFADPTTGVGQEHYKTRFGIVAGTTTIPDNFRQYQNMMGERFLVFKPVSGDRNKTMDSALKNMKNKEAMRRHINETVKRFVDATLTEVKEIPEEHKTLINMLAMCLATFRTHVQRDYKTRDICAVSEAENPARLVQQLSKLYISAVNISKDNNRALQFVRRLVHDSIPENRYYALRHSTKPFVLEQLVNKRSIGRSTLKMVCDDMVHLGIFDVKRNRNAYQYSLEPDYIDFANEVVVDPATPRKKKPLKAKGGE